LPLGVSVVQESINQGKEEAPAKKEIILTNPFSIGAILFDLSFFFFMSLEL
jgi:hypothetical protein